MSRAAATEGLVLERVEAAAASDEWSELALRSRNVFGTPEWLGLWWDHYGKGRRRELLAVRDRGRLVAILPLYVWSERPARVLRFLGHGPGDELGPVCAPEDRLQAAAALASALEELGGDMLLAERLPGDGGWGDSTAAVRLHHEASPTLEIGGRSWDEFIRSRSSNFRDQSRRFGRRLAREHTVRMRLADDPARIDEDIARLFELHREQWPEGTSDFTGDDEAFQRAFARVAFDRGWLRLWLLDVDDVPVAASYILRFGGADADYQSGRLAAWNRARVGWVLLMHTLQDTFDTGLGEYRLMRGGEPYKYRLATRDHGVTDFAYARTLAGHAATLAARHRTGLLARTARRMLSGLRRG